MIKCDKGVFKAEGNIGTLLTEYAYITRSLHDAFIENLGEQEAGRILTEAFEFAKSHNDAEEEPEKEAPAGDGQIRELIDQLFEAVTKHTVI